LGPIAQLSDPLLDKPLLAALAGRKHGLVPIWLMRQAGRYLPEYRALRRKTPNFLDLCLTPELAVEATLQPIRRYAMDAAIVFSDILLVPRALGQDVAFDDGKGPLLAPLGGPAGAALLRMELVDEALQPVYATLRMLRRELPPGVALIGFAGAPWTLASYMVEGGASKDFATVKAWAYGDPASFERLIDLLTAAVARHLIAQIEAGAEVVQIFDSWAGVLAEPELRRWSVAPVAEIARRVKAAHADVPILAFPRGAGAMYAEYRGMDGLSLDHTVPLGWAAQALEPNTALQGNLDPAALLVGGGPMRREAERILGALADRRFVFNLGHGVLPNTPPEHVAQLVETVRGWRP